MKRGLTLIEMLLSLAIVSAMMIVAVGWMHTAGAASTTARTELSWQAVANAAMQVIHDDLATGDFELTRRGNTQPTLTVTVENSALSIVTRSSGKPAVHVYRLDASTNQVRRSGSGDARVMIGDVTAFTCDLDEDERVLTVTIQRDVQVLTRRYKVR